MVVSVVLVVACVCSISVGGSRLVFQRESPGIFASVIHVGTPPTRVSVAASFDSDVSSLLDYRPEDSTSFRVMVPPVVRNSVDFRGIIDSNFFAISESLHIGAEILTSSFVRVVTPSRGDRMAAGAGLSGRIALGPTCDLARKYILRLAGRSVNVGGKGTVDGFTLDLVHESIGTDHIVVATPLIMPEAWVMSGTFTLGTSRMMPSRIEIDPILDFVVFPIDIFWGDDGLINFFNHPVDVDIDAETGLCTLLLPCDTEGLIRVPQDFQIELAGTDQRIGLQLPITLGQRNEKGFCMSALKSHAAARHIIIGRPVLDGRQGIEFDGVAREIRFIEDFTSSGGRVPLNAAKPALPGFSVVSLKKNDS